MTPISGQVICKANLIAMDQERLSLSSTASTVGQWGYTVIRRFGGLRDQGAGASARRLSVAAARNDGPSGANIRVWT